MPCAGQHGLERRDAHGDVHSPDLHATDLDLARDALNTLTERIPNVFVEDKGLALALHYRAAPETRETCGDAARDAVELLGEQFAIQAGKMVFEIKPSAYHKGTAIQSFMDEAPFLGKTPLFFGDDVTDEDGFSAIKRVGGYAVKVGGGKSSAPWRLPDPAAVRGWLRDYLNFLQQRRKT